VTSCGSVTQITWRTRPRPPLLFCAPSHHSGLRMRVCENQTMYQTHDTRGQSEVISHLKVVSHGRMEIKYSLHINHIYMHYSISYHIVKNVCVIPCIMLFISDRLHRYTSSPDLACWASCRCIKLQDAASCTPSHPVTMATGLWIGGSLSVVLNIAVSREKREWGRCLGRHEEHQINPPVI